MMLVNKPSILYNKSMPEWVLSLLGLIGLARLWRLIKRVAFWLKPQGLVGGKSLIFQIGETAYTASHPFVDEREVSAIICQVIFGNPDKRNRIITTFRLEVKSKSPYLLSEARDSDRGGSYLAASPSKGQVTGNLAGKKFGGMHLHDNQGFDEKN